MSDIRLVVLDLDGTLLDPVREAPIRPAVVSTVRRVLDKGVGVTLATGRTWEYAHLRARELGIHLPLVTGQGATLAEAETGKLLYESFLPMDATLRAVGIQDACYCLYFRDPEERLHIVLNRLERELEYYLHLLGPQTVVNPDLASYLDMDCQVIKCVVFSTDTALWQKRLGSGVQVARTHADLVEATAKGVDKGSGLRRLLSFLGLPGEQVMAVGDNENDLPMFARVGLPVAMGQAPDTVKQAARWVAPPYEEDGVAAALERFILS